jgi:REP element-mobilizing transposase RayT
MGLRYKYQNFGTCFFITTSFRDRYPWGNIPGIYEVLITALKFQIKETRAGLVAYVLMPTHIHLALFIEGNLLADFIRDFKKYTAQKSLFELCGEKKIWQNRYDRQIICSVELLIKKIEYIHYNPVKLDLYRFLRTGFGRAPAITLKVKKGQ